MSVPGAAGLRVGEDPGNTESTLTPETCSSTSPMELLTVDGTDYEPYPGMPTTAA
ncbi:MULTISPECIES: hypothetical protein [Streptomyces]|uniref:hypothetical protein n=1 Tax=Streptomyces TaxID=1883 RepID=UPI0012FF5880|nr:MULTISPECIES: hypothetical protein [Streptomyces]